MRRPWGPALVDRPAVERRPTSRGAGVAARSALFRIRARETSFAVRGFAACPRWVREELELHGRSFADGFNAAMATPDPSELRARLESAPPAEHGFAYEGAAMALALLDLLPLGRPTRFARFLEQAAERHPYMAHVGAGWALARLRRRPWGRLPVDPLLRWLALDGYGFHDAFFHPRTVVARRRVPPRRVGGHERIYDQGVGRALWFVAAADPSRVARTIGSFDVRRQAELWSGVGLAAAYAGAVTVAGLERLSALAGRFHPHLAQGVAFAAKARLRAGNLVPHTENACEVVCGLTAERAAHVTDRALAALTGDGSAATYERWRMGIRARLATA